MQFEKIITGAAGFVGTHICRHFADRSALSAVAALDLLPIAQAEMASSRTDIRSTNELAHLAAEWSAPALIHLAALAEVVMPFEAMTNLTATNVQGTINLLAAFEPQRFVFASSCAVYGNAPDHKVRPTQEETAAVGSYGVSKRMGEIICSQWAQERKTSAVALRFGNIVGPGCRGLIPYLVAHAIKYPDGSTPAQLRGQGRIVRDYVAVEYAVAAILQAADIPLAAGESCAFNIASGRGLTNGEVAHLIADTLAARGYRLAMNFDNPIAPGESAAVLLDIADTARLGIQPPTSDEVAHSIEQATLWHLEHMLQAQD